MPCWSLPRDQCLNKTKMFYLLEKVYVELFDIKNVCLSSNVLQFSVHPDSAAPCPSGNTRRPIDFFSLNTFSSDRFLESTLFFSGVPASLVFLYLLKELIECWPFPFPFETSPKPSHEEGVYPGRTNEVKCGVIYFSMQIPPVRIPTDSQWRTFIQAGPTTTD